MTKQPVELRAGMAAPPKPPRLAASPPPPDADAEMPLMVLGRMAGPVKGPHSLKSPRIIDTVICRRCGEDVTEQQVCTRPHAITGRPSRPANKCDLCGREMPTCTGQEVAEDLGWRICSMDCLRLNGEPLQKGEKFVPNDFASWRYTCVQCGAYIGASYCRLLLNTGKCPVCQVKDTAAQIE